MQTVRKGLKHRLQNCRYYYTYGLFDLRRKKSGVPPVPFAPETLQSVGEEALFTHDSLLLVDREHPVTADREGLSEMEGFLLDPMVKAPMEALFSACLAETGEKLLFTDTYRTLAAQEALYGVNPFAVPAGESEHHTGLAADIKTEGYGGRRFLISKAGRWTAQNAHRFGFIIRYPLWAQKKTGIDYEPWHLRYVGIPHAEAIYRQKQTLEEYLSLFTFGDFYRVGRVVLSRQRGERLVFPPNADKIFVSRDTRGGRILWGEI